MSRALRTTLFALTVGLIGLTASLTPAASLITRCLLAALAGLALWFVWQWPALERRLSHEPPLTDASAIDAAPDPGAGASSATPRGFDYAVGFVANFFDTLGIGSFAPTTAALKFTGRIPDEQIPGTLNVGHALPTLTEALIFIAAVTVDPRLLLAMIGASILGAWCGAGIVSRLSRLGIQLGMGAALGVAALLFIAANLHWMPIGGDATSFSGERFAIAVAGNVVLGALMTLGIGLYAPCLIMLSLLGLDPHAAFPIMMGSCAFLMPIGGMRFVRTRRYSAPVALGFALGGPPAVLVAAWLVKSMSLVWLRWLVAAVVLYAAATMLWAAARRVTSPDGTPVCRPAGPESSAP